MRHFHIPLVLWRFSPVQCHAKTSPLAAGASGREPRRQFQISHVAVIHLEARLDSAGNGQVADLGQDLLNTVVQIASGVLFPRVCVEVLLYLCHPRVCLCTEP
jgi:hypothetical protein